MANLILTKDQTARVFGIPISETHPGIRGCCRAVVLRREPVKPRDLVMFRDASVRRLSRGDNQREVFGVVHSLLARIPKGCHELDGYELARIFPNEPVQMGAMALFRSGRFGRVRNNRERKEVVGVVVPVKTGSRRPGQRPGSASSRKQEVQHGSERARFGKAVPGP